MVWQFLLGLLGGTAVSGVLNSVQTRLQRGVNNLDPVQILQAASYADAFRLNSIDGTMYYQYMRELGFSPNQAKVFFNNTRVFLSKEDASIRRIAKSFDDIFQNQDAVIDGTYTNTNLDLLAEQYCIEMYKIGYDRSESIKLFESLRPVPTFSILLEWLAKEVFEPKVRARFLLDDDYPEIWAKLMDSIKVPEFEAKAYWAAHWTHPSPGQIGDMYTRWRSDRTDRSESDAKDAGVTSDDLSMSKDDFTEALKLHEIAPFWRDRIIANSYRPLPLTTLQQAYVFGLEDDDWFLGRLKDYGYSGDNAGFILKVWRRKFPYASKAPRADNILLRIQTGETHLNVGIEEMTDAGIPVDASRFVCHVAYDKWILRREKEKIKSWRRLFKDGSLSRDALFDAIKASGYSQERANGIWELVIDADPGYRSRLRLRDLTRGLNSNNLTEAEFRDAVEDIRVYDSDIDTLVKVYTKAVEPAEPDNSNQE